MRKLDERKSCGFKDSRLPRTNILVKKHVVKQPDSAKCHKGVEFAWVSSRNKSKTGYRLICLDIRKALGKLRPKVWHQVDFDFPDRSAEQVDHIGFDTRAGSIKEMEIFHDRMLTEKSPFERMMEVGEQYLPRRVLWGLLPEALLLG